MNDEMQKAKAAFEAYAKQIGDTRTFDQLTVRELEAWLVAVKASQPYQGPG
jgi:hypothetical protein